MQPFAVCLADVTICSASPLALFVLDEAFSGFELKERKELNGRSINISNLSTLFPRSDKDFHSHSCLARRWLREGGESRFQVNAEVRVQTFTFGFCSVGVDEVLGVVVGVHLSHPCGSFLRASFFRSDAANLGARGYSEI